MSIPPIHAIIKIKITTVINSNSFWCIFRGGSSKAFESLMATLNDPGEITSYKLLIDLPVEHQLVIVKANDGKFYRGRVYTTEEDERAADVLLVDFGIFEKIKTSSIFQWVPRFAQDVAFQAVEMEVANVRPLNNEHGAIKVLNEMIVESKFKAVIVENIPGLKCRLFSGDDDIGDLLINLELALPRQILQPVSSLALIPV